MRVLTVGNMYPPHSMGGYEMAWQTTVGYLRDRGHDVDVLCSDHTQQDVDPDPPWVHRDLRWYWHDHEFPRLGLHARLALERRNHATFAARLEAFRPDLVSWWSMGGMSLSLIEAARREGMPAVGVVCDDWLVYGPRVDAWTRATARAPALAPVIERFAGVPARMELGPSAHWIFLSEAVRGRAREAGYEVGDSEVCHRGIEHQVFRRGAPHEWTWRLGYAGRLDERKGVDIAVGALAELPAEATLTIDGRGDDRYLGSLEEQARAESVAPRVSFQLSDRAELPGFYETCDAILFPVRWDEPWGLVPLEAMAVGTPVIASGRGGSGEYLRDGENCLVFDPDDGAPALAAKVQELAADPDLRTRIREGGFATAAGLDAREWDEAIEAAYERALGGRA